MWWPCRLLPTGFRVPAFDHDGRMRAAGASALIGHPTSSRCYEVHTAYGRSIKVTGDHSLFVEGKDGRPEARPTALPMSMEVLMVRTSRFA